MRHLTLSRFLVLIVMTTVFVRFYDPWPLQLLRLNILDSYQQISPRQTTSDQIVLVQIDEKSLMTLGQWPWPRDLLTELIEQIIRQKPKALGIDILFPEADRSSPEQIALSNQHLPDNLKQQLALVPSNDQKLAISITGHPVVLSLAAGFGPESNIPSPNLNKMVMIGKDGRRVLPAVSNLLRNIPLLDEAATGQGISNLAPDQDGLIRKIPLLYNINHSLIPSFETEILRVASGTVFGETLMTESEVKKVRIGPYNIPTDQHGHAWIHFTPNSNIQHVSAWQVLAGETADNLFSDKIVLLGVTAVGIADYTLSPTGENLSGLSFHAQALDSILTNSLLVSTPAVMAIELGLFLVIGLSLIFIALRYSALELTVTFAVLGWTTVLLSWGGFYFHGFLIDPTLPFLLILVMFLVSATSGFITEQRQRHFDALEAAKREREKESRIRRLQNELMHTIGKSSVQKLSSSIAHEMNQPMAAICNYTNTAKRLLENAQADPETLKPELLKTVLEKILAQAHRGNDILKSIREVAETGSTTVRAVDINQIIQEEIELIRDVGSSDLVTLYFERTPELPAASANEIQLHQVVMNLIRNAMQAIMESGQQGNITVRTSLTENDMILVSIRDTGPGLSKAEIKNLFKPFYTTKMHGMGLGLSICRSIIEALGGSLWVEKNNEVDQKDKRGAVFLFTLPLDQEKS
ncbi:CHASE2 domain-containing protein [Kiloniella laminariae]|uniref:histidine kinase n=1 Tax=Kiloniella laminariae TaxID=454162 RepID=A0ABT4LLJ7_9PROT|nr:CHASE2 domain-containing protein [Kiloniella laminariae]MCZ4281983.1 CHASE2 domain-containing protein [Kiloniella laminariae]